MASRTNRLLVFAAVDFFVILLNLLLLRGWRVYEAPAARRGPVE